MAYIWFALSLFNVMAGMKNENHRLAVIVFTDMMCFSICVVKAFCYIRDGLIMPESLLYAFCTINYFVAIGYDYYYNHLSHNRGENKEKDEEEDDSQSD